MNKRDAMIAKLRQDFRTSVLVVVMGAVFQQRRKKAGLSPEFVIEDPEHQLDALLKTATVRQLKMLREAAKHVGPGEVVSEH
jgi:hypothetical protein